MCTSWRCESPGRSGRLMAQKDPTHAQKEHPRQKGRSRDRKPDLPAVRRQRSSRIITCRRQVCAAGASVLAEQTPRSSEPSPNYAGVLPFCRKTFNRVTCRNISSPPQRPSFSESSFGDLIKVQAVSVTCCTICVSISTAKSRRERRLGSSPSHMPATNLLFGACPVFGSTLGALWWHRFPLAATPAI